MNRRLSTGYWGWMGVISIANNTLLFVVFPMLEVLSRKIPIKAVVDFLGKILTVVSLKINILNRIF